MCGRLYYLRCNLFFLVLTLTNYLSLPISSNTRSAATPRLSCLSWLARSRHICRKRLPVSSLRQRCTIRILVLRRSRLRLREREALDEFVPFLVFGFFWACEQWAGVMEISPTFGSGWVWDEMTTRGKQGGFIHIFSHVFLALLTGWLFTY